MAFIPTLASRMLGQKVHLSQLGKSARSAYFGDHHGLCERRTRVSSNPLRRQFVITPVRAQASVHPGSVPLLKTLERPPRVAVTRERGKNDTLIEAVEQIIENIEVIELPCVATFPLPAAMELGKFLATAKNGADNKEYGGGSESDKNDGQKGFDWIVVTSPEAATFVITSWRESRCPPLPKLAVVGRATASVFHSVGVKVSFIPSKATGRTLCAELPTRDGGSGRILYATSLKASGDIEQGLNEKGYEVVRLNAYTTETAVFDRTMKYLGSKTDVVTFGSPSAVRGWMDNVGLNEHVIVACIGETSANAARKAGFTRVHFPQQPGLDGWVVAICEAMSVFKANKASGLVGGGRVDVDCVTDEDGNIYKA